VKIAGWQCVLHLARQVLRIPWDLKEAREESADHPQLIKM